MAQIYQQKNAGKNSWTIRVFTGRDGQGKRKYVNYTVQGTKKQAEAAAREYQHKHETGQLTAPRRQTLAAYLEEWNEAVAVPRLKSERTKQDYIKQLRRYIVPVLGGRRLSHVRPVDIQAVYSGMLERGLSPTTVILTHRILHSALKQAVKWDFLPKNPAEYVELPSKTRPKVLVLSDEEARAFLRAAEGGEYHAFLVLLLTTGLRPSEAIALRWADIDLAKGQLQVRRKATRVKGEWLYEDPKTHRSSRLVELLPSTSLLLARVPRDSELVFHNGDGEPLDTRRVMNRGFRPILEKIGVKAKLRLYDLRHTHATLLLLNNEHPKVVSERLGHSSIQITLDTYSHVLPSMQRSTANRLDELLFEQTTEERLQAAN
jgi:integrase